MRFYHNTGRTYDGEQELVIDITKLEKDVNVDGFWDFTATFKDASRGITGVVTSVVYTSKDFPPDSCFIEAIMYCYDNGFYC